MNLINRYLDNQGIEARYLPTDLQNLIEATQKMYVQASTIEQTAQVSDIEKAVVLKIVQHVQTTPSVVKPSVVQNDDDNEPTTVSGESMTYRLNKGEVFPKFKGSFHWVAIITGASKKYQFERKFVSERIFENGGILSSAVLTEGNLYEIKDGYDNFFATLENGKLKKIDKAEVITRFNATKREPKEQKETPSVMKAEKQDVASDIPFAQYLSIVEANRIFVKMKTEKNYDASNHNLEFFIDSESNIFLKYTYTNNRDGNTITNFRRIGKGGKNESFYHEYQSKKVFYEFVKGKLWGVPVKIKDQEGYFRPCDKDGDTISFVNGKVVESNAKRISELGYAIEQRSSMYGRFVVFKDKIPPTAKEVGGMPELKPIVIPLRMRVPDAKREPHYKKIEDYGKLNVLTLTQEIVLGKMEMAQYKYWDSNEDYYKYYKENELVWVTSNLAPEYRDYKLYATDGMINWGNYRVRYNGKKGSAYVYLDENLKDTAEKTSTTKEPKAATTSVNDDQATAKKFFATAAALLHKAEKWIDSHKNANTNTPRRRYQYNIGRNDANIQTEKSAMYNAIGEAYKNGNLPEILRGISSAQSADDLEKFVFGTDNSGYYSARRTNTRNFEREYSSKRYPEAPAQWLAIQQLLGGTVTTAKTEKDEKAELIRQKIEAVRFADIDGFYPTPIPVIEKMLEKIREEYDGLVDTILEPSAGIGSIADALRDEYPNAKLDVCESVPALREILKLKGHNLIGVDTMKLLGQYDLIVMNPPFENGQDVDHVRYCYDYLLKEGGVLVAIMSNSYTYNSRKKFVDFRDFLNDIYNQSEVLPENSFKGKDSFRQTGVRTIMLTMRKSTKSFTPSVSTPKSALLTRIEGLKLVAKYSKGEKETQLLKRIEGLELVAKYA